MNTNIQKLELGELEKVLLNLLIYVNPEVVLPSYASELIKGKFFNLEMVKKYWQILSTIDWFVKKISKYESFFIYFYPNNEKISESDALEHHIHAYLEDVKTLKNKLLRFVISLKRDLKKIAINKKEIFPMFQILEEKITKPFVSVSKLRKEHRHLEGRFLDHYVADAQNASFFLNQPLLKEIMTEEGLAEMLVKKQNALIEGKGSWSKKAANNYWVLYGMANTVAKLTKNYLYQVLDLKPILLKD
jgi:hypothetical protein